MYLREILMKERQSCLYSRRRLTLPPPSLPPQKKQTLTTNKISNKLVTDVNSQVCVLHKQGDFK